MKMKILFGLFLVSNTYYPQRVGSLLMNLCLFQIHFVLAQSKVKPKSVLIDNISDHKDLKKILRTKNNVMILYTSSPKSAQNVIKALDEAAASVKGEATAVLIDCSLG